MLHDVWGVAQTVVAAAKTIVLSTWENQVDRFRVAIRGKQVSVGIKRHSKRIDLAQRDQLDSGAIWAKAEDVSG